MAMKTGCVPSPDEILTLSSLRGFVNKIRENYVTHQVVVKIKRHSVCSCSWFLVHMKKALHSTVTKKENGLSTGV